jgi:hypothetical protein
VRHERPRQDHDAGLGVAVERHQAALAEHLSQRRAERGIMDTLIFFSAAPALAAERNCRGSV